MADLSDVRVLMIATDGFENDELFKPRQALIHAGAKVTLASISTDPIQGEKGGEKADTIAPDITLGDVDTEEFDALVIPGGVANPDKMRMQGRAVQIVEEFMDDGKIVAAICHGPWLLVEADVVDGRKVTSWPSIRTDLGPRAARCRSSRSSWTTARSSRRSVTGRGCWSRPMSSMVAR